MEKYLDSPLGKIYTRYYLANESNAIIILIHGLGEHMGRYASWAGKFKPYNYTICGLDLPGHGKSEGKRGHFTSVNALYNTIDIFIEQVKNDFPDKPLILYGHSMGGNIAGNYLIERQPAIKALILSSPWLRLSVQPNFFKFWLAKWMYKIFPSFPDATNLNPGFISRIPEEVVLYKNDELVHGKITPGLFVPLFFNGIALVKKAKKIYCSTLVVHGTNDKLTSHKASQELAEKNDKIDFIAFEGGYHELHHDSCQEELFEAIIDWLSVHIVMR